MENLKFHVLSKLPPRMIENQVEEIIQTTHTVFSFGDRVKAKGHCLPFFPFDQQSFQTLVQFWTYYFQHIVIKDSVEAWLLMAFRCCLPHPT